MDGLVLRSAQARADLNAAPQVESGGARIWHGLLIARERVMVSDCERFELRFHGGRHQLLRRIRAVGFRCMCVEVDQEMSSNSRSFDQILCTLSSIRSLDE